MPRALKLSEAAAIALHSAGWMAAREGDIVSTRSIAARFQVSEAHLSKVMQRLVKAGIVSSIRGPKGGFTLVRPAEEITLLEVYEVIEGPIEPIGCLFQTPVCDGDSCVLGTVMADVNETLRRYLAENRLSDIRQVFTAGDDRDDDGELVLLEGSRRPTS